eukprot:CAMPEP_0206187224 /NCGR_PEP_ID=MMETSP0166-20121206/2868_1 /ASSEMBLY_ACC=CAM_ASM_000260 /TAXON_ID=95228 /ORGANISM="Vannella robusta, Strain DIVA3 518/3/11/1/6" /LENGTH=64 /DNA_ID=CAMNT_0053602753 /DNA_START=122 /DNA_END=313 /DNA_ORIENTATION=+
MKAARNSIGNTTFKGGIAHFKIPNMIRKTKKPPVSYNLDKKNHWIQYSTSPTRRTSPQRMALAY